MVKFCTVILKFQDRRLESGRTKSSNSHPNARDRRALMTIRTPADSDTPSGTEVLPLTQHLIRELPLATRERSQGIADLYHSSLVTRRKLCWTLRRASLALRMRLPRNWKLRPPVGTKRSKPLKAKINDNKLDVEDFKIPRKTAKSNTFPKENSKITSTKNKFAALNTANDDVEDVTPAAPKVKPVMMKLFPEYNLILQDIHRTHPTATNTHIGGHIKIQAESADHQREITQFLTDKQVQYYVTDHPPRKSSTQTGH
ncbi:uncharacterized protein TNCV_4296371 [Trichonephila clavipes]|nr:uncharacterized protein TNCV_4296371 [Trichonephila clavipes]